MKKVLSIILAVIMIMAMLPTTFAAVDETTGAITYEFSQDSHGATSNKLETYKGVPATSCTKYPENITDPGYKWAYLGTNAPAAGNDSSKYFAIISNENEVPYILTASLPYDGWVAFKIYVPEKGLYDISGKALGRKDGSTEQEVYIIPAGDKLTTGKTAEETFVRTGSGDIYGTLSLDTAANKYIRSGAMSFSQLGITADYLVSTSNTYSKTNNVWVDMTEKKSIELNAGDNILLLREADISVTSESKRLSISSLTLTPAKLDKTHKYVFNNTVLTGDILNNIAFTSAYRMFYIPEGESSYSGNYLDSYDNLNSNLTDLWSVSTLGGFINSSSNRYESTLDGTRLQMVGRKSLNKSQNSDANFVLKLNVKHNGIYAATAEVEEYALGTQADIYMLPADETITDINSEILKNYNSIGRVSNVTGEVDGDIGAVQLTEGNWYLVFAFNSTNKSTAAKRARQYFNLESIKLTEIDALPESGTTPEAVEDEDIPEISFSATTSIPDKAKVTINGNEGNLAVINPARGDEITVSAPEVTGYKFIGWKSGSANDTGNGELANTAKFVKDLKQTDTFTVYTSTFLTAVYEEIASADETASVVEFWNLDGSYLGSKTIDKITEEGGLPTTSLIGHTFTGWFTAENVALNIAEIVEKVTHAVAGYTADATLAATEADAVRVNGVRREEATAYGKEVICTDNGEGTVTHWLRDGKVVSYDPTYKYYVWDTTNITSSYAPIEKKPLVVLDDDTVSDAYMIEYDGAGKAIVEVGILFGEGTPTVASKSEIFKSQRGDNHGQFAAMPTDDTYTARGYMIYEDTDGSYKVIYSD